MTNDDILRTCAVVGAVAFCLILITIAVDVIGGVAVRTRNLIRNWRNA